MFMQNSKPSYDWMFETGWEVCNKIGGIYTVLSTKAKALQEQSVGKVVFIGPDVWSASHPCPCFKEYKSLLKGAASKLKLPYGISVRIGRWQVPGIPLAVLVDTGSLMQQMPQIYGRMWELYGVDSLHAYGDYTEGCTFAVAAAIVVEALIKHIKAAPERVVAHFDEWTTAMGLLYLQSVAPEVATVFTTHATSIGRSICSNGKPLYDYFTGYHGDQMANELNMESKHSLEKVAAHRADCFTTVSGVTARECVQLLEAAPQVVTPNGFEPNFVPKGAKYARVRKEARSRLLRLATALTGRSIEADALSVATSGRNEYRNKGIDLYIDAMQQVRGTHPDKQVVAFIMVPAWSAAPLEELVDCMEGRLGAAPEPNFITHRLHNEDSDPIFRRLAELHVNNADDKVVFIFLPCYLDGADGVLNLSYYDMVPGLDLTVFPSYYEPWGYTPLESIAFGVPAVTTDKAGFGQWITDNFDATFTGCGVEVVGRTDSNYDDASSRIAQKVGYILGCESGALSRIREAAQHTAAQADWSEFMDFYKQAYAVAMCRRDARVSKNNK